MTQVTEPFPIFYDDDGTPLENGMIYVGAVNQNPRAVPVQVYYDAELTEPALQPIRTLGGRPAFQGEPTRLYIAEAEYSIDVQNRNGTSVTGPTTGAVVTSSDVQFIQTGANAVARTVQSKLREAPVSLADYSGTVAAALTSALDASDNVAILPGTYSLGTNVSLTGAISWHNEGTWTGAGSIVSSTDYSGFNYSVDFRRARVVEGRGTAASPVTDKDTVALFSKHSNFSGTAEQQNPALVAQLYKYNTGALTVGQAIFAEAIDRGGNTAARTDFVEGIRAHGIGIGGPAYGGIFLGQVGDGVVTPNARYAVAVEGEVIRTAGSNALNPLDWVSTSNLDASFLATCRIGVKPMGGFVVNPFNVIPARCGFLVMNSLAAQGVTRPIVDFAAFATIENNVPHGLYVRNTTFSWASVPNNIPLRALNAAGSSEHNILNYDTSNIVNVGVDSSGVRLYSSVRLNNISEYADDAAAAAGGVPITGLYRTASVLKIRVS